MCLVRVPPVYSPRCAVRVAHEVKRLKRRPAPFLCQDEEAFAKLISFLCEKATRSCKDDRLTCSSLFAELLFFQSTLCTALRYFLHLPPEGVERVLQRIVLCWSMEHACHFFPRCSVSPRKGHRKRVLRGD